MFSKGLWEVVQDFLPVRVWLGLFLGVMVSLGLAAAYVFGGGIELLDNGSYRLIDSYAFNIALFVGVLVPASYFLYFRDLSTSAAVFLSVFWGLHSGLQDIFVYLLLFDVSLPAELPWLSGSGIGILTRWLGFSSVTPVALLVSVLVSGFFLLVLVKILHGLETRFTGVPV